LLFIARSSPKLNQLENIGYRIKRDFTVKFNLSLDLASIFIENEVKSAVDDVVKKACGFEYIISVPFWTKIYSLMV
jgi:hypothetical protein